MIRAGDDASPLPLLHTTVTATVTGAVASVAVGQTFDNPFTEVIELSYLFPLPHAASILDYEIRIGSRTIRGELKEIETAQQAYEAAKAEGKTASLLEQRRPNLFAVQLGNVQPGQHIVTTIRYQERLHFADDSYTFVFPMGVTPKYHADPTQAALVDSPIAAPREKIGGASLTLSIDAGVAVEKPTSPSHSIQVTTQDERRFTVTLPEGTLPNKDFVLRYAVAKAAVQPVLWSSADADGIETLLLTLIPPRLSSDLKPEPREFIYVIDRSGSMNGEPLVQAKNALRACLRAMNLGDTFTIQAFDDQIEWFDQKPQPVTQEKVTHAERWLDTIDSRGGTEIVGAITAALALPSSPERQRYVVFLTDGAVSAEEQAQNDIRKQRGNARIFTFGIGSSVNRALLAKMAEYGRGVAEFLQLGEDIETAITRFQDRVSYPVLQDLALTWQNAETWDVYPALLPDLYVGQALELVGRLKRKERNAPTNLTITGKRRGETVTLHVPIPATTTSDPMLTQVWARARVDALLDQPRTDANRQQIISLALDHHLLTPYTAFVAVDSEQVQASGETPRKITVSVPLPQGVTMTGHMVSGYPPQAMPASAARAGGGGGLLGRITAPMRAMFSAPAPAPKPPAPRSAKKAAPPLEEASELADHLREIDLDATTPAESFASIGERIKWLARTQNLSGSWGSGANEGEFTAAALLAFVRAGHTTRAGNYRVQVRKAAEWLKVATLSGFATFVRWRALRELDAAQGTAEYATDDVRPAAPTSDIEQAAFGNPVSTLPTSVDSLDTLRLVALVAGEVGEAAGDIALLLLDIDMTELIQAWFAVGKPNLP
jgi:Ca-activated chloride channel family protein